MVILNKLLVVVVEFPGVPRPGWGCPLSCPLSLSELVHVSNLIPRLLSVVPSHQGTRKREAYRSRVVLTSA